MAAARAGAVRWALLLGLAALSLGAGGCGPADDLHGSLGEAYPLRFERVRARLYPSGLAIEYVDLHGAVPVRVSLDRAVEPEAGRTYELVSEGDVTGETHDGLPLLRFRTGTLQLDEFEASEGKTASGSFDVDFQVDERVLSLHGTFAAPLDLIGWEEPATEGGGGTPSLGGTSDTDTGDAP